MSESVGARLRQARELRKLSIQQVSETTRLRPHYLQALESDDHSAIPSAAQARGFLRIYAEFLQLNIADLIPAAPAPEPAALDEPVIAASVTPAPAPGLWANLLGRFTRRSGKDAVAPSASLGALPAQQPAVAPASADVAASTDVTTKTARRPKPAPESGSSELGAVKKNVEP